MEFSVFYIVTKLERLVVGLNTRNTLASHAEIAYVSLTESLAENRELWIVIFLPFLLLTMTDMKHKIFNGILYYSRVTFYFAFIFIYNGNN